MLMKLLNILYLLVAIAMVALILVQRGTGAAAGSSFGGGASGSVFGSQGAGNFLTKSTKWLAVVFISISLFMAWLAAHTATGGGAQDFGVMSSAPTAPVQIPATSANALASQPSTPGAAAAGPKSVQSAQPALQQHPDAPASPSQRR